MKISEIRKSAREALDGKWGKAACIPLVYMALSIIIGFVEELVGEGTTLYNIIEIAYFIISVPLSFGLIISFIRLRRGETVSAFDFFKDGFSKFGKSWGIWFHIFIRLLLPAICFAIATVLSTTITIASLITEQNQVLTLLCYILSIVSIIWIICKSYLYSLAYYISFDNPELLSVDCVKKSAKLMKGNRGKYFLLELSFIGWAILALFTLGIGMLWLMPYMQIASICFYEKLTKPEEENADEVLNTKE